MQDYSQYYIKDLLEAIEEGCQKIGEKRDYVKYLLSMEQAESVEKLIEIYDNIYKLLFVFTYGNTFPHDWYKPESGGYYKSHLVELLNRYFNDNIERLSKESGYLSREMLAFFIANLRECINAGIVQSKMMEKRLDEEKAVFLEIGNAGKTQYRARKRIESMSKMDSGYKSAIKIYNRFSALLALKGRIFDVSEIAFAKDNGIDYNTIIEQYKEDEERRKRLEEEKTQKLKDEKEAKKTNLIIGGIILVFCLFLMYVFFMAIGGFVGFVVLIGLIGSIPKVLLKGKF